MKGLTGGPTSSIKLKLLAHVVNEHNSCHPQHDNSLVLFSSDFDHNLLGGRGGPNCFGENRIGKWRFHGNVIFPQQQTHETLNQCQRISLSCASMLAIAKLNIGHALCISLRRNT